jgi:hypothetical protein
MKEERVSFLPVPKDSKFGIPYTIPPPASPPINYQNRNPFRKGRTTFESHSEDPGEIEEQDKKRAHSFTLSQLCTQRADIVIELNLPPTLQTDHR